MKRKDKEKNRKVPYLALFSDWWWIQHIYYNRGTLWIPFFVCFYFVLFFNQKAKGSTVVKDFLKICWCKYNSTRKVLYFVLQGTILLCFQVEIQNTISANTKCIRYGLFAHFQYQSSPIWKGCICKQVLRQILHFATEEHYQKYRKADKVSPWNSQCR